MTLDIVTLMAAASLVAALSALVLGGAWFLMRERALAWWSASSVLLAFSIFLLIYGVLKVDTSTIVLGGALAAFCPALVWAGVRDFSHRAVSIPVLFIGSAIVLFVAAAGAFGAPHMSVRFAGFLIWIGYLTAAIFELWRGNGEHLRARWPLICFFALHVLTFAGGILDTLLGSFSLLGIPLTLGSWFGLIHVESLIYSMGTAVFMVVMCKERSEFGFRQAANFDALTGAASRGAFTEQAERLFARARKDNAPLTIVLLDLDRFKTINDTFGHRAGDRVLRIFVDSAGKFLRPADRLGRYGGEEFAIVLPSAGIETGYTIAERIRLGFAEACREVDGGARATLSAGVAERSAEQSFEELLERADAALYRAKNLGRNRIERADSLEPQPVTNVIKIA